MTRTTDHNPNNTKIVIIPRTPTIPKGMAKLFIILSESATFVLKFTLLLSFSGVFNSVLEQSSISKNYKSFVEISSRQKSFARKNATVRGNRRQIYR